MYQTITDENITKQVFSLSTYGLQTQAYATERETDFHSFYNKEDFWKYQLENQMPDSPEQLFSRYYAKKDNMAFMITKKHQPIQRRYYSILGTKMC